MARAPVACYSPTCRAGEAMTGGHVAAGNAAMLAGPVRVETVEVCVCELYKEISSRADLCDGCDHDSDAMDVMERERRR
jgi:hypothetical protein